MSFCRWPIQDFRVEVNQGQTTTFFLKTDVPARFTSRPLGLITESKGVFVNDGTTTEYATQIVGTSIDGIYAKIQSTESRVYSLITDAVDDQTTGVVSSTTVTRIRGQTTTIETTQLVRTFIDDVYAQEIVTGTEIFAPLTIEPTTVLSAEPQQTVEIDGSQTTPLEDVNGGLVFKTSHLTQIVGERVVELSAESKSDEEEEEEDATTTEEDRKKVIATFNGDEADTSRRGMRKLVDQVTKTPVVLQTIQARTQLDSLAAISAEITTASEDEEVAPSTDKPEDETDEEVTITPADDEEEEVTEEVLDATTEEPEEVTTEPTEVDDEEESTENPVEVNVDEVVDDEVAPAVVEAVEAVVSTVEAVAAAIGNRTPRIEVSTEVPFVVVAAAAPADVQPSESLDKASVLVATLNVKPAAVSPVVAVESTVTVEEPPAFDVESSMEDTTEPGVDVTMATPVDELSMTTRLTTFTLFTTELVTEDGTTSSVVKTREVISTQVELVQPTLTTVDVSDDVFTTLYTTYTYFSTLFDDKTTKLINREEIVTNVVPIADLDSTATPVLKTQDTTSVPDTSASPVNVESSIEDESGDRKGAQFLAGLPKGIIRAFMTTFTFFTTELVDGTTVVSSRIVVSSNTVTPTIQLEEIDEAVWESLKAKDDARKALKVSVNVKPRESSVIKSSSIVATELQPVTEATAVSTVPVFVIGPSTVEEESGTESTLSSTEEPEVDTTTPMSEMDSTTAFMEDLETTTPMSEELDSVDTKSSDLPLSPKTEEPTEKTPTTEEPVTEIAPTPPSTEEPMADKDSADVPVVEPSVTDAPVTFYTTFTYFTTVFTEGKSSLISHEETLSNVAGDSTQMTQLPTVFPTTYYTTYTYRTTSLIDDKETVLTHEETVSNVVTPGVGDATQIAESSTLPVVPTVDPLATTYFTTFTYFSTSVDAETTLVTSSMETVTNVVTATPTLSETTAAPTPVELSTARVVDVSGSPNILSDDQSDNKVQSTGLLSTISSTQVNSGVTTQFTTQVIGTFINGQFARIMESSSEVLPSVATVEATPPGQLSQSPTGVVSINVASVYDVDHPVTTIFTTRLVGVYSDNVYSTTTDQTKRLVINGDKTIPPTDPSKTGLIRITTGSIVAESTTTIYQTKVIGTLLNGLYAEVLESSSSVVAGGSLPPTVIIAATGVEFVEPTELPKPTESSVTEIEGSIVSTTVESTDSAVATKSIGILGLGAGGRGRITSRLSVTTRSKTFTPLIRPFNRNRNRPSAVPAGVENASAASVTNIRPTINRFSRPPISITPTSRNSPGFSRSQLFRSRGSSAIGSSVVNPTPVSGFVGGVSSSRRVLVSAGPRSTFGGFNSRLRSTGFPGASSSGGSGSSLFSNSRRFPFPSRNQNVEAPKEPEILEVPKDELEVPETTDLPETTEIPEELDTTLAPVDEEEEPVVEVTTPRSVSSFRRPLTRLTNTRRQFPLARPSASTTVSSLDSEAQDSETTTVKPRFRRPPKLSFTVKPREVVSPRPGPRRLPFGRSRFGTRPEAETESAETEAASDAVGTRLQRRSKRQLSRYEEYYYESPIYRKRSPQRSSLSSRQSSRTSGSRRLNSGSSFNDDYDYTDFEEEEVVVTSRPRSSTRKSNASALRERLRAQQQGRTSSRPTSSSRSRPTSSSSRFRPSSSSRRRPSSSSSRSKSGSSSSRRPSGSRRRPPFSRPKIPEEPDRVEEPIESLDDDGPEILPTPVTVTHYVPVKTVISVNNAAGEPELKTILKAQASTELINSFTTTKIEGTWRYLASMVTDVPNSGTTEITQFFLKPTPTSTVTFTPTTIRGRPTSFSHVVPTTAYEIETIVSTISDPVVSTNNLLQQLLLGGLNGANPLLGLTNAGGETTPTTSFRKIASTYVTTLTEFQSTVFPLTVRGKVFTTTLVGTSSSVITATEISTETIVIEPTPQLAQPNQLASLLPLLQAQLLNQQQPLLPLLQPQPVQPIVATEAPPVLKEIEPEIEEIKAIQPIEASFDEVFEEEVLDQEPTPAPKPVGILKPTPKPKPAPVPVPVPVTEPPLTSVVTLYLSGRFPGEFSSIISTITLDGPDATVVKRQTSPSEVVEMDLEASALPYMVETDEGFYKLPEYIQWRDIDYYIASAINDIDDGVDTRHTQPLDTIKKRDEKYRSNGKAVGRKVLQFEDEELLAEDELAFQQFGSRKRSPDNFEQLTPEKILLAKSPRRPVAVTRQRLVSSSETPDDIGDSAQDTSVSNEEVSSETLDDVPDPAEDTFTIDREVSSETLDNVPEPVEDTFTSDREVSSETPDDVPEESPASFFTEISTESVVSGVATESETESVAPEILTDAETESVGSEIGVESETESVASEVTVESGTESVASEVAVESETESVVSIVTEEPETESESESATELAPVPAPVTTSKTEPAPEPTTESATETSTRSFTRNPKKIRVSSVRKPVKTPSKVAAELPVISSSKDENEALTGGSIFAPRVYYTIYSYLYTILNGPNAGSVSTREVSLSSLARGRDTIIPTDFHRTESNNGVYFLTTPVAAVDLSTRVKNDVTTQVNLASATLVKYGRGRVASGNTVLKSSTAKPRTTSTSRRVRVRPTLVEPSFEAFDTSSDKSLTATQKLPPLRQSRTRIAKPVSAIREPEGASKETPQVTSAKPTVNRGRGTVRFNGAASLQRNNFETEPGFNPIRTAPAARTRSPTRTSTITRTISRGSKKLSATRSPVVEPTTSKVVHRARRPSLSKTTPKPTPVRKIIRTLVRSRVPVVAEKPIQELTDDFELSNENVDDDFDEFDNDFYDDEDDFDAEDGSFEYDDYSSEQPDDGEFFDDYDYYDYEDEEEPEEVEEPVFTSSSAFRTGKASTEKPALVAPATKTPVVATPTARIIPSTTRNSPIGSTFIRKRVNPLDKHLSSILAHSRSSLKFASAPKKTVERETTTVNRFRLGLRQSLSATQPPTFSTSTVVLKTFSTTSTLALDGIRNGIELTLLTSTLTTLFDDDLKLLTQSPELFKPVTIQPTPVFRPNSNLLKNTRTRFPFRSSFKKPEITEKAVNGLNPVVTVDDITQPSFTADGILTSTEISSSMEEKPEEPSSSINPEALLPLLTLTQVETQLRTYTAVVTRVNGDESLVTTRLEVLPELVTKTIVQVKATSGIHSIDFFH